MVRYQAFRTTQIPTARSQTVVKSVIILIVYVPELTVRTAAATRYRRRLYQRRMQRPSLPQRWRKLFPGHKGHFHTSCSLLPALFRVIR